MGDYELMKIKTEIIQDLLYKCVENLYEKYSWKYKCCFELSDVDFDDGIMFIRLNSKFSEKDNDFELWCNEFLETIEKEVCVNHICLKYDYQEYDIDFDDGDCYEFCEIGFEIKLNDRNYELDYTNGDY